MGKKSGPKKAAAAQVQSAQMAIDAQQGQFDYISELVQPFIDIGLEQEDNVRQGASAGGLDERLGEIFNTETFKNVNAQREKTALNSIAQSGMRRSGAGLQQLTDIPLETALALEGTLFDRQSNIFGNGQNASVRQGANAQQSVDKISSLINQQGQATAAGILQGQQASAQQNAQIASAIVSIASAFSDPSLKENMEPVGQVCDLTLYEWDWKEEVPEFVKTRTLGYNAAEVKEKYPQHISEIGGYLTIHYDALNEELNKKLDDIKLSLECAA